jgi:hypothetical protein
MFAHASACGAPAAAPPSAALPSPPAAAAACIVDLNSLTVGELLQALCAALGRGG